MMTGLLVTVTSGVVLAMLAFLFRVEEARGSRLFLTGVRDGLDRMALFLGSLITRIARYVNVHIFRVSFHYIVHTVLGFLIAALHRVQNRLSHLQLRNRHIVKAVKKNQNEASHLEQLATFKAETALSEQEKNRRREQ